MHRAVDDDELIRRTLDGQADAFGDFYRRHERVVLLYLLRRTAAPDVAADLAAETFAAALESLGRYKPGRGPAIAWLLGIAKNKLLMSVRAGVVEAQARSRLALEPLMLTDEDLERVDAIADAAQDAEKLDQALASLPESQREAVLGRVVRDRTYAELSTDLRCSEAVVRQRVSRGLRSVRVLINEETR
jgi:RNA polymerase sigma factor (sigma-70 family)